MKEKLKRMHNFEKNVSQRIKIKTNIEKKMEMEINKDKIKNPFKYNFLNQKALNDYVIYKQFDQFGLNIDKKGLGNEYLKEIKDKVKDSKVRTIPDEPSTSYKKVYKNYLVDARKNIKKSSNNSEIDKLYRKYGNKSEIMEALEGKIEEHRHKALDKANKLKMIETYERAIKTEEEIDEEYLNSIKARLAYVEVSDKLK